MSGMPFEPSHYLSLLNKYIIKQSTIVRAQLLIFTYECESLVSSLPIYTNDLYKPIICLSSSQLTLLHTNLYKHLDRITSDENYHYLLSYRYMNQINSNEIYLLNIYKDNHYTCVNEIIKRINDGYIKKNIKSLEFDTNDKNNIDIQKSIYNLLYLLFQLMIYCDISLFMGISLFTSITSLLSYINNTIKYHYYSLTENSIKIIALCQEIDNELSILFIQKKDINIDSILYEHLQMIYNWIKNEHNISWETHNILLLSTLNNITLYNTSIQNLYNYYKNLSFHTKITFTLSPEEILSPPSTNYVTRKQFICNSIDSCIRQFYHQINNYNYIL